MPFPPAETVARSLRPTDFGKELVALFESGRPMDEHEIDVLETELFEDDIDCEFRALEGVKRVPDLARDEDLVSLQCDEIGQVGD